MPRSIDGHGLVIASSPPPTGTCLPSSIQDLGADARERLRRRSGLGARDAGQRRDQDAPVSVCHQVSTIGHRWPPMLQVIPDPRFGVDRLADRSQQPQRRQVVACAGHSVPHFMNARIAVGAV